MKWDWSQILQWAIRHAENVPELVSLILAAYRAQGFIARMKAFSDLYAAVQAILADFPMPGEQVFGGELLMPICKVMTLQDVSDDDAQEVWQALEA